MRECDDLLDLPPPQFAPFPDASSRRCSLVRRRQTLRTLWLQLAHPVSTVICCTSPHSLYCHRQRKCHAIWTSGPYSFVLFVWRLEYSEGKGRSGSMAVICAKLRSGRPGTGWIAICVHVDFGAGARRLPTPPPPAAQAFRPFLWLHPMTRRQAAMQPNYPQLQLHLDFCRRSHAQVVVP